MGKRTDFGSSWDEIVASWYHGVRPLVSDGLGLAALDALERLWPERLDRVLQPQPHGNLLVRTAGAGRMAPLIDLGISLRDCETLPGFSKLLENLRNEDDGATAHAYVASTLVRLGYRPELERPLNKKVLDAYVPEEDVYVEVAAPRQADQTREASDNVIWLSNEIAAARLGKSVEVRLLCDPSSDLSRVVELVRSVALQPSGECNVEGLASVRLGLDGNQVQVTFSDEDERAKSIVGAKSEQLSKGTRNLLVLDVSLIANGVTRWCPLVSRLFQPSQNTRFGAIALCGGLNGSEGREWRWTTLQNPHAANPLPESLLAKLASIGTDIRVS